jgi:hypothetical protein
MGHKEKRKRERRERGGGSVCGTRAERDAGPSWKFGPSGLISLQV